MVPGLILLTIFMNGENKLECLYDRPLLLSVMFAGMAKSLPYRGVPERRLQVLQVGRH